MSITIVENVTDLSGYDKEFLLSLYRMMQRCRVFDVNLIGLLGQGKVGGFYHSGQGHEGIAAGCSGVWREDDYLYYAHRGCNAMIGKGVPLMNLYADFMNRIDGTTKGLGAGIVHSAWPSLNVMGQSGTLGESFVIAPGTAWACKHFGTDQVVFCHNGDGTHAREVFHGGMNFASLHKLPVLFICENNHLGAMQPFEDDHAVKKYLAERAEGYCMPAYVVDGKDPVAVYETVKLAAERARAGEGPTFIEMLVNRHRGHFEGDPLTYVDLEELARIVEEEDPIKLYGDRLVAAGIATNDELAAIEAEEDAAAKAAIEEADKSPLPPVDRICQGLFNEEEVK